MGKVSIKAELSKEAQLSKALRKALGGITQTQLGTKLLLSRNYISQIESDLKTPSPRVISQMEQMLTEATRKPEQVSKPPYPEDEVVLENYTVTGSHIPNSELETNPSDAEQMEVSLRHDLDHLINAADGDVGRLGWIREQFRLHLLQPVHWGMHEQAKPEMTKKPPLMMIPPRAFDDLPGKGKPITVPNPELHKHLHPKKSLAAPSSG